MSLMWPALAVSGFIVTFSGFFFIIFGPLGLFMLLSGPVMIAAGLLLKEPNPPLPEDPTMKYCKFCQVEIYRAAVECPECGFPCDE